MQRTLTYISYAVMALFAMQMTVTGPLLPAISRSFDLGLAEAGLVFTANFAGFVAFILAGGVLADRWGKKRVLSVALAGFAVSLLLVPLAPSFALLCAASFLVGGFGGVLESQVGALIAALNPERASYYLNLSQVFFGVGALIGPLGVGLLLAAGVDWRACYVVLGALALALTALFAPMRAPLLAAADPITWPAFTRLVGDGRFLLICLCLMLYTGAEVGSWGWLTTFLSQNLAFSVVASSAAVGVFWAAVTVGRFLIGPLTLRFATGPIIVALALAASLVTLASAAVGSAGMAWAVIVLLGLALSSQWPMIVAFGNERYPASSGTVFALLVGSGGLGTTVIPLAMGAIGEAAGMRAAMASPSVAFLAIAVVIAALLRRERRAPEPAPVATR